MTSEAAHKPQPLSEAEVRRVVLEALSQSGYYIESFSFHARFDHPERHLSIDDVIFGLKSTWRGCKAEEFNDDEWQWKYLVKTHDIEGNRLIVPIALDPRNKRFTVITAFYEE